MIDEFDFGDGVRFAYQFLLHNNIDNFWLAPILLISVIAIGGALLFWLVKIKVTDYVTRFINASASRWDCFVMNDSLKNLVPWLVLAVYFFFSFESVISADSEIFLLVYYFALSLVVVCLALMGNSVSRAMLHPDDTIKDASELRNFKEEFKGKRRRDFRRVAKCAGVISLFSLFAFILYASLSVLESFGYISADSGFPLTLKVWLGRVLYFVLSFSILFATFYIFKFFVFGHVSHYVRYSKTIWDDVVFNRHSIRWISLLIAEGVLYKVIRIYIDESFVRPYSAFNFVFNLVIIFTAIVAVHYATYGVRHLEDCFAEKEDGGAERKNGYRDKIIRRPRKGLLRRHWDWLEGERRKYVAELAELGVDYDEIAEDEEEDGEERYGAKTQEGMLIKKIGGIDTQIDNLKKVRDMDGTLPRFIGLAILMLAVLASFSYIIYFTSRMTGIGEGGEWMEPTQNFLKVSKIISVAMIVYFILRHFVAGFFMELVDKTKTKWDDVILNERTLNRFCLLLPVVSVWRGILREFDIEHLPRPVVTTLSIYVVVMMVMIVFAIGGGLQTATRDFPDEPSFKKKPLNVFAQTMEIIAVLIAGIVIVSILMNSAPTKVLAGLGASAALITFIFKDSLVGLLSGVQLSLNNMVSVGDWITIPGTKANGRVESISLNTVKIRNFDKTIVTVQPSALMSGSFQNNQIMLETNTRQIQRTIQIDLDTVRRLTKEDMRRVEELFEELRDDIRRRNPEYEFSEEVSEVLGAPMQTNLRLFRLYLKTYISNLEVVDLDGEGSRIMIRQMQPTEMGLPIEIHVFVKVTEWVAFEEVQSGIFDYVFAMASEFGLRLFQIRMKG